jgi:ATP-dependent exoDNAse (exonuclease V) beta subunit
LIEANRTGMPWNEMGVLYRRIGIGQQIADALSRKRIPFQWQQDKRQSYLPSHDSIKLITMHSSKGLEFSLVGIPAVGAAHGDQSDLVGKMQRAMGVLQH